MASPELYKTCFIKEYLDLAKTALFYSSYQINRNTWEILASENQGSPAVSCLYTLYIMTILKT